MKQKASTFKRGLAAATAVLLTLSAGGLMSTSAWADTANVKEKYSLTYKSAEEYEAALKAHGVKEGVEGLVLAQNENSALPLAKNAKVAVFGTLGYGWSTYTGGPAKNDQNKDNTLPESLVRKNLAQSLKDAGFDVNNTIEAAHFSGGGASPKPDKEGNYTVETWAEQESWSIDKATTTGIVVLGRGGAEGTDFRLDAENNPLALTENELSMVDYAKAHCQKVVVLIITANAMELGPIIKGGAHEVDAICYGAQPNDYSYEGFVKVLSGEKNATGAMNDTFVYSNSHNPGNINYGLQAYANEVNENKAQYNKYNVLAEGVYVGYKYYETRYYDLKANPSYQAGDAVGSSTGNAWDYSKEVVYTFGHGLSYYDYTQEITDVKINRTENGLDDATVKVTNNSSTAADFTAQLYVNRPYTQYDIDKHIEKSAVDFLNSAKVYNVPAKGSKEVHITVPTKYLASYDAEGHKTYFLDKGDYWFTAAAGAHEAVNNVLAAQNKSTDNTNKYSSKAINKPLEKDDATTYSKSTMSGSEVEVTNVADGKGGTAIDINYYLPGSVTYLSRSNWKTTFPKNYTNTQKANFAPEAQFDFSGSAKYDEWLDTIMTTGDYKLKNQSEATLNAIKNTDEIITGVLFENAKLGDTTLKELGYKSYWDFITQAAVNYPEEFDNVYSELWQIIIDGISLNDAAGSIFHGGSSTDLLASIQNPTSKQRESVFGKSGAQTKNGMKVNIASNTLLGCAMNPQLSLEWGRLEGEGDRWTCSAGDLGGNGTAFAETTWGAGLNIHRTAYNGRNSEYVSEDPMLANRVGYYQQLGVREKGAIMGPKHMGFNTQETQRQGIANYMTEQTMRETDMRCYQGALSEGDGMGVMLSFSRIGATNAVHHAGIMNQMLRYEWGFMGIMTTDMGQKPYMQGTAMAMASVNQFADFAAGDSAVGAITEGSGWRPTIIATNYGKNGADLDIDMTDTNWADVTLRKLAADTEWCAQARLTEIYELYALAHTWNINQTDGNYKPVAKDAVTENIGWNGEVVDPNPGGDNPGGDNPGGDNPGTDKPGDKTDSGCGGGCSGVIGGGSAVLVAALVVGATIAFRKRKE